MHQGWRSPEELGHRPGPPSPEGNNDTTPPIRTNKETGNTHTPLGGVEVAQTAVWEEAASQPRGDRGPPGEGW